MFNEITSKAIKAAFEHPGEINENLVDAQQARRVLDRLVGYKISPLLWDKVRRGLSAGRVQTVALRLIVDREMEIRAFVPVEYWTIHAILAAGGAACHLKPSSPNIRARILRSTRRPRRTPSWPRWKKRSGKWRASRRRKSAASRRLRSRRPNFSRPPTTACGTRPSAPWASRSDSMKAWSWARKARSR